MVAREKSTENPGPDVVTILLVEDGTAVRKAVRFILQKSGYQVLEASNAREALDVFRRHEGSLHLLLTDVMLPEVSGPELARQLGAVRPEMKVLYVSGHSDREVADQKVLGGGEAFLRKPFAMEELLDKVQEVLEGDEPSA
jgi:DNA-binding NtrC family response regulator